MSFLIKNCSLFTEFADFEMERFRIPSAEMRNGPRNSDLKNPAPRRELAFKNDVFGWFSSDFSQSTGGVWRWDGRISLR